MKYVCRADNGVGSTRSRKGWGAVVIERGPGSRRDSFQVVALCPRTARHPLKQPESQLVPNDTQQ